MNAKAFRQRHKLFIITTAALVGASALHILSLIDARSLWADELSTIYKSAVLNAPQMLNYLRTDAHPPLYYLYLKCWFIFFEPSTTTLRLASWIPYLIGGILITIQTLQLGRNESNRKAWIAACLGALIAFSSPIALRFSIEGKGYSLMVMLITAGLLCRQNYLAGNNKFQYKQFFLAGTSIFLGCAALTHYYGLFLILGFLIADSTWIFAKKNPSQTPRVYVAISEAAACLPAAIWALINVSHLSSGRGIGWIGRPDYGLFESTLASFIGPFPIPKIAILIISLYLLQRKKLISFNKKPLANSRKYSTTDLAGVPGGLFMVFAITAISFLHPVAYSRYFVVLLPIIAPFSAVLVSRIEPKNTIAWLALLSLLTSIWIVAWNDTFSIFRNQALESGSNKTTNYRAMSILTANDINRFTVNRLGHARTSDLVAKMDNLVENQTLEPWDFISVNHSNSTKLLPNTMVVAATGKSEMKALKHVIRWLSAKEFECKKRTQEYAYVEVNDCLR